MQALLEIPRSDHVWKLLQDLTGRHRRVLPKDMPGLPWLPAWAEKDESSRDSVQANGLLSEPPNSAQSHDLDCEYVQQSSTCVPAGTFVATHGQQTLSNAVWALATLDVKNVEGLDLVVRCCIGVFCQLPSATLHPQVRHLHLSLMRLGS